MLKYALLAASVTISAPVFAQTGAASPQSGVMSPAAPMSTSPAQPATQTDPAMNPAPADSAAQAASAATGPDQVAKVVDADFATYDMDGNGVLSKAEFSGWMIALKQKSDPAAKPDSVATKSWVGKAFASADKDKSKTVTKAELTGFLAQGQS